MQFLYAMGYASAFSPILAIIVFNLRARPSDAMAVIYLLCELALLTELLSRAVHFKGNNLPYLHAYTLLELGLVLLYFSKVMPKKLPGWIYWLTWISLIATELALLASNYHYFFEHNPVVRSLSSLISLGLALWYFLLLLLSDSFPKRKAELWVGSGLLLYFSVNFVLFLMSEVLVEASSAELAMQVFVIHSCANIVRYLLFAMGAWQKEKVASELT